MTKTLGMRTAIGLAVVIGVLAVPVAGASASDASIRSLIKAWSPKILVSEGKVVSAIGEYKKTRNPAPVATAIDNSIGVLRTLRTKIEHQSAISTRVKKGKFKLETGLHEVIVAYEKLKLAFKEKAASPAAANANAEKADVAVKKGKQDLREGLLLLK